MEFSKRELLNLIDIHYGLNVLRMFLTDSYGQKQETGRSKADLLDFLEEKVTKAELLNLVSSIFFSTKHHTFIYESGDEFNNQNITNRIRTFNPDLNDIECEIIAKDPTGRTIDGLVRVDVKAQKYDQAIYQFTGQTKTISTLIPFRVSFSNPKHAKVKISKFVPNVVTDETGTQLSIHKVMFDEDGFSQTIRERIVEPVAQVDFLRSNLTTSIKELVRQGKIGAVVLNVTLDHGPQEGRAMDDNPNRAPFIDQGWYDQYLFGCRAVRRAKWYFFPVPNTVPESVNGLQSLTIDPTLGKVSQDAYSKLEIEGLIDEIIAANDL